jgi:hypothetical protein
VEAEAHRTPIREQEPQVLVVLVEEGKVVTHHQKAVWEEQILVTVVEELSSFVI